MIRLSSAAFAAIVLAATAGAQTVVEKRQVEPLTSRVLISGMGSSLVGLAVSSSITPRDTLGVLISRVTAGGAAEMAGLEEGNRIAAINGVNLRVSPADVGQSDMQGIMARRFERELAKVRAGDTVRLRVFANDRFRDVAVQTRPIAPLSARIGGFGEDPSRATIGAIVGGSATRRDTLGVFIAEVAEDGPLGKAGIYEGSRIAGIGTVDLRVPAASAGDAKASADQVDRLVNEVAKLAAGAKVELRVYEGGRYRNVTVEAMRSGDVNMPSATKLRIIRPGGGFMSVPLSGELRGGLDVLPLRLDSALLKLNDHVLEIPRVELEVRGAVERALLEIPRAEQEARRAAERALLEIPRAELEARRALERSLRTLELESLLPRLRRVELEAPGSLLRRVAPVSSSPLSRVLAHDMIVG